MFVDVGLGSDAMGEPCTAPAQDGELANRQATPASSSPTRPRPSRRAPSIDYLRVDGPERWPWRSSPDLGCNPSLSSGEPTATPTSGATCRRIVDSYLGGWNRLPGYPSNYPVYNPRHRPIDPVRMADRRRAATRHG